MRSLCCAFAVYRWSSDQCALHFMPLCSRWTFSEEKLYLSREQQQFQMLSSSQLKRFVARSFSECNQRLVTAFCHLFTPLGANSLYFGRYPIKGRNLLANWRKQTKCRKSKAYFTSCAKLIKWLSSKKFHHQQKKCLKVPHWIETNRKVKNW